MAAEKLNIEKENLIQYDNSYKNRATWVHPLVATNIANWISAEFSINLSLWIEERRNTNNLNNKKYIESLNNIKPDKNNNDCEKKIQVKLLSELGGKIEVETPFGFIDLLTDTEIIEIKNGEHWKNGLGQLCAYSKFYPAHRKRLHLFNMEKDTDIEELCKDFNIRVSYDNY